MKQTTISAPIVKPIARDRLYNVIERTQLPQSVETVLKNALDGSLWEQRLVFIAMVDTWPRLAKALEEVAREVCKAPFTVVPFAKRNEDASPEAVSRAEYVEDAQQNVAANMIDHELDYSGLYGALAQGYFYGHHVLEILWHHAEEGQVPKAFRAIDPKYYRYPRLADEIDRLMFNRSGHFNGNLEEFPKHHFIAGINTSHLGHPSVAAPMRALVGYWIAANFGLKWFMEFAQIYGVPMRWATYPAGDQEAQHQVSCMLDSLGSAGWGAFPSGTEVDIKEASKSAGELPQAALIDLADRQVDIRILGQSLTTDVGDSGSRALGDVHDSVRKGVIVGVAQWVANVVNNQLIPSIVELRYGDREQLPKIEVEWPEQKDTKVLAEVSKVLFQDMKIPVGKEWLYDNHGVPMPETGDELYEPPLPPPSPFEEGGGPMGPSGATGKKSKVAQDRNSGPTGPTGKKAQAGHVEGSGARVLDRPIVDQLTDSVLENMSGTSAAFLAGVRPFFRALVEKALDANASDQDFIEALQKAQSQLPEIFDQMNRDQLSDELAKTIGTAIIAGSGERILDF